MFIRLLFSVLIILVLPGCFAKKHSKERAVGFSFGEPTIDELKSSVHSISSQNKQHKEPQSNETYAKKIHGQPNHSGTSALFDVPVPFLSKPLESYTQQTTQGTMAAYSVRMPRTDLESFYKISMEQSGWLEKAFFQGPKESLGSWQKSHKICQISFRDVSTKQSTIIITLQIMEEDNS